MDLMIALIPLLPLLSSLFIMIAGGRFKPAVSGMVGSAAVAVSAVLTVIAGIQFFHQLPGQNTYTIPLWEWINAGDMHIQAGLRLDALSLVFCFVITFVGALIHIYSIGYMKNDEGFRRFFACMNLFVFSMLVLVLADNMLLLYLGWEGVGLCSYLLIGFWYKKPENGYAARKAFIVTRIGDTAMLIGLILLFIHLGTLHIDDMLQQASLQWVTGSPLATASAALLLGGALGKSAQLPLQVWLPDAMAGPSPVSALIHAATMVTAGVYLIARTNLLFTLAPVVQAAVAIIGAATLLIAGLSALAQHDLKRILAYSTISQIGYMFLALGVGAWSAGIFHFMIHAFFKALLFLAAGAVIMNLHEEHNIFKMGGLRKKMPAIFLVFLAGSVSLAALPLVSAGFYSKDQILWASWAAENGSLWFFLAGLAGAFITALYTFRMVFITFFGNTRTEPDIKTGRTMLVPMIILAVLSIAGGFIQLPSNLGGVAFFSNLTDLVLPALAATHDHSKEFLIQGIAALATLSGIFIAYRLYYNKNAYGISNNFFMKFFYEGFWFDRIYNTFIIKPVTRLAEINKHDFTDLFYRGIAKAVMAMNSALAATQNGSIKWYLIVLCIGIASIILIFATA